MAGGVAQPVRTCRLASGGLNRCLIYWWLLGRWQPADVKGGRNVVLILQLLVLHHGRRLIWWRLVWLLLRRGQKRTESSLSAIPKDVLRMVVGLVIKDETARLEPLYMGRVQAGGGSWRG